MSEDKIWLPKQVHDLIQFITEITIQFILKIFLFNEYFLWYFETHSLHESCTTAMGQLETRFTANTDVTNILIVQTIILVVLFYRRTNIFLIFIVL